MKGKMKVNVLSVAAAVSAGALCSACLGFETDSLKPFPVLKPIPASLENAKRGFDSAPSVTVSPGGRVWVAWHAGGNTEGEDNAVLVATSGDDGRSWSQPLFALDAPGPLRGLDPGLWTDSTGKVWLFYAQIYSFWDGRGGVWAMHPADPERGDTEWSAPRRLCDGFLKNKPVELTDGRWLLPVEFMNSAPICGFLGKMKPMTGREAYPSPEMMGANVFESRDRGRTVRFLGQGKIPGKARDCTENMVYQKRDGSLRQLVRTSYGIGESVSRDGGKTWTEVAPSNIQNPSSRFFIGRLKSGALLLVKNGPVDRRTDRRDITAFVSDDDGATWTGGLVLDARRGVSYPDAAQDGAGRIHVVNDHERTQAREIMHHVFAEADVRAGRLVTPGSRLGDVVTAAPRKVIFDTDMYTDFDDVGALAILHATADAGECEILGTLVSTSGGPSAGMVEMVNAFYGRPDLPIGRPVGMGMGLGHDRICDPTQDRTFKLYTSMVAAAPNVRYRDSATAPDANGVYRRLLAAAPDHSVTIVTTGFTTNMRRLLETKGDAVSPLDGKALVAKKVRAWCAMACRFPDGEEYNSKADAESSRIAFDTWPTPVYFLDYMYGKDVHCGVPAARKADGKNLVKEVFSRALKAYGELDKGHPSWDELAVLAAVRGPERYYGTRRGRFMIVNEKGANHWEDDPKGNHYLLTVKTDQRTMEKIIDELICREPKR